jgi:hypothetical protein
MKSKKKSASPIKKNVSREAAKNAKLIANKVKIIFDFLTLATLRLGEKQKIYRKALGRYLFHTISAFPPSMAVTTLRSAAGVAPYSYRLQNTCYARSKYRE